jgi:hypothetical protein
MEHRSQEYAYVSGFNYKIYELTRINFNNGAK